MRLPVAEAATGAERGCTTGSARPPAAATFITVRGYIVNSNSVRIHALAAGLLLALGTGSAVAGGRIDLSGLQSADRHDQFIVKYRDGSTTRANAGRLQQALDSAAQGAASNGALGLKHVRSLAVGAEVVRASRKLDRVDAQALMRQLAANPDVEYVEVDRLLQAVLTPNDPQYPQQ